MHGTIHQGDVNGTIHQGGCSWDYTPDPGDQGDVNGTIHQGDVNGIIHRGGGGGGGVLMGSYTRGGGC